MRTIYGFHAIEESFRKYPHGTLLAVERLNDRAAKIKEEAVCAGVKVKTVSDEEIRRLSAVADCKGLLYQCRCIRENYSSLHDFLKAVESREEVRVFILDSVTDPHNFGAILRSADQFDMDLVITRNKRSAKENDTVAVTSAGAVNYVNTLSVTNLNTAIDELKDNGFWVYGADIHGTPLPQAKLNGRIAVVMGSEGKGLSRLTAEKCDGKITIPTYGNIDSLNVSVAAGVLMYEIRRQTQQLS